MRHKVFGFKITPLILLMDQNNEVCGETEAPSFITFPGKLVDLRECIDKLEEYHETKESNGTGYTENKED